MASQESLAPSNQSEKPIKQCSKCTRDLFLECFDKDKSKPDGLRPDCKRCKKQHQKLYYKKNKESILAHNTKYRENNPEYMKQYRVTNRESLNAKNRQYYANNRESALLRMELYREENRETLATYMHQYFQTPHGKFVHRANQATRRARKRKAQGSHTSKELREQLIRQNHKCYYCHAKLGDKRSSYHADHIAPLSRGGTNYIDNIVLACSTCNLSKNDKLLHEWTKGGRLL